MSERLATLLESGEYLSYAYAYPHKTAYRTLTPEADLKRLWAEEDRSALFLYIHVPFCEQRCGFCNLFTQVQPKGDLPTRYVEALETQARVIGDVLAPRANFARLAIGGGTPTYLSAALLDRVLDVATRLGAGGVPSSVEVSPSTLDDDKIAVLAKHRVTRVSMGVQSVLAAETSGVQRRQANTDVERGLRGLEHAVPVRNVDLIYGLPGQTAETLRQSIDYVVDLGANEIYLYPLYVRPLTILARHAKLEDARVGLYRAGRDHLVNKGFRQSSMRMFAAPRGGDAGPAYRCQDDGMIGLGPGARSYTKALHYASPFAVGQHAIRDRIAHWMDQSPADHAVARHGIRLGEPEQRRRYVLLSLLDRGVDRPAYRARFGSDVLDHAPELAQIVETNLGILDDQSLRLTELGVERADVLGHWLQSDAVKAARQDWAAV